MPSDSERMILAGIVGQLSAPTPPEYSAAVAVYQGSTSRFNYSRPEQKQYQGRTAADSGERIKGSYGPSIAPGIAATKREDRLYSSIINNQLQNGLYSKLMSGHYKN